MRERFCLTSAVALAISLSLADPLWAIPNPPQVNDIHTAATVDWKAPGSPALPWTTAVANSWNHQDLTPDTFDEIDRWHITAAWDNRTYHYTPNQANYGHGMILPDNQVRYFSDATVPARAQAIIVSAYNNWQTQARAQFQANRDADDALALGFIPARSLAASDIHIDYNAGLAGAYGEWFGRSAARNEIQFIPNPAIRVGTGDATVRIRLTDGTTTLTGTSITVPLGWSYDGVDANGNAATKTWNVSYSKNGGAFDPNPANAGLVNVQVTAGRTDTVAAPNTTWTLQGMDFRTIASHEIGHSIALSHPRATGGGRSPAGNIMRADIGSEAILGRTQAIDNNSALAVAIDYTWSFDTNNLKDYGDAPDSYKTYLSSDGPRYKDGSARFGTSWDAEPDGSPTPQANGDEIGYWGVGGKDDADGIVFGPNYVDVTWNVMLPGLNDYQLRAWWDLNNNGVFDHPTEMFINDTRALNPGVYTFRYNLPFDPQKYYSRFRLTYLDPGHTVQILPDGTQSSFPTDDILPYAEFVDQVTGISTGEVSDFAPVPEPATVTMLALGVLGLFGYKRRR
jgi:hypothetical protein